MISEERFIRDLVEITCAGIRYAAFIGDDGGRPGKGEEIIVLRIEDSADSWEFSEPLTADEVPFEF